jgi:hypothetical protein
MNSHQHNDGPNIAIGSNNNGSNHGNLIINPPYVDMLLLKEVATNNNCPMDRSEIMLQNNKQFQAGPSV